MHEVHRDLIKEDSVDYRSHKMPQGV
jgi:hypothetical protein